MFTVGSLFVLYFLIKSATEHSKMNPDQKTYAEQVFNCALKMYGDAVLAHAESQRFGESGTYETVCYWQNELYLCAKRVATVRAATSETLRADVEPLKHNEGVVTDAARWCAWRC